MTSEIRFIAAPPLGRLCRWLRTLGFDCLYLHHEQPEALGRLRSDRVYLTRHVDPAERRVIFIGADLVFDQLKLMDSLISLKGRSTPLSRCIECNTPLVDAARDEVKAEVPEHVFLSHDEFTKCPSCGRIYWPGTHVERMDERISELLG
jgi:uncharacterized protein with PIN domain